MQDRIDIYVVSFMGLSNNLVVYLRTGRHIDKHVCLKGCLATQSSVIGKPTPFHESLFGFTRRRQIGGSRDNVVPGEFAFGYQNLASTTNGPPATDRIDVDTKASRSAEYRRRAGETTAFTGRRKDHLSIFLLRDVHYRCGPC
jgi:hypothetical protein